MESQGRLFDSQRYKTDDVGEQTLPTKDEVLEVADQLVDAGLAGEAHSLLDEHDHLFTK
jgi:hypothetical protein